MAWKPPFLRSAFNYDMFAASDETAIRCEDPTLTQQSMAEDCDINTIVKRFGITGTMPPLYRLPVFQDYEGVFDFHTAMQAITDGREAFMEMPGELRARFGNDPQAFLEFCNDAKNRDEAQRLGLLVPAPATPSNPEGRQTAAVAAEAQTSAAGPGGASGAVK